VFSGADLQAFVYNAHLDVVHASIASNRREDIDIEYTTLKGIIKLVYMSLRRRRRLPCRDE
jgi:hypothetical protein